MSGPFARKYTDEQRDAVIAARLDRGIKLRRVVELAESGDLAAGLEPFTMPISTIASLARDEHRRRTGKTPSKVAELEPRDAIEALRTRLVSLADSELAILEKKRAGTRDPAKGREIAKLVREIQAIPGRKQDPRPGPGQRSNGTREGGEVTGLGAGLIKAHRNGDPTATVPGTSRPPTTRPDRSLVLLPRGRGRRSRRWCVVASVVASVADSP
jgi:hypothetical protein